MEHEKFAITSEPPIRVAGGSDEKMSSGEALLYQPNPTRGEEASRASDDHILEDCRWNF